jgi:carboxyl-terminal processing protease
MEENLNNNISNSNNLSGGYGLSRKPGHKAIVVIIGILLLLITFSIGVAVGINKEIADSGSGGANEIGRVINTDNLPDYLTKDVNFKLFWKVWDTIKNKFIDRDQITDAQLFYGAMAGVVGSLEDPYSIFLNPQTSKEFSDELNGKFEGIGAEIGIRNNQLTIISPLPESPAQKAGIRPLDKIIAIDSLDTAGMSLDQAVSLIRGDKGTEVVLTITRDGLNEAKEIGIVRNTIKIVSVSWEDKDGVAYIKLTNFNSDTSSKFLEAVNEIISSSPKGIILDLRNNPGGYLETAVDIAGYWAKEGQVVVREEFSNPEENQEYFSNGKAQLSEFKTVVLVNGASASASEIVAGALQDYQLGTVVGETTFGKGSVQELEKLSDGSSIKLTIARWLTPYNRTIDKNGIQPDFELKLTEEDINKGEDPQMTKALEIINQE